MIHTSNILLLNSDSNLFLPNKIWQGNVSHIYNYIAKFYKVSDAIKATDQFSLIYPKGMFEVFKRESRPFWQRLKKQIFYLFLLIALKTHDTSNSMSTRNYTNKNLSRYPYPEKKKKNNNNHGWQHILIIPMFEILRQKKKLWVGGQLGLYTNTLYHKKPYISIACRWRSENNLQEAIFCIHHLRTRDLIQKVRLGSKCLYPLNNLADSILQNSMNFPQKINNGATI